jgi:hypothetical protein
MFKTFNPFGALTGFKLTATKVSKIYTGFVVFEQIELSRRISLTINQKKGLQPYKKQYKIGRIVTKKINVLLR